MNIYIIYLFAWFPMLILAILNGILRDLGYKKYIGDLAAHQLSTVSLLILFGIYICLIVKKYTPSSTSQSVLLGLFWMVLTLLFEFGFGAYRGNSWEKMLLDYNLFRGRIWMLAPIALAIGPYVCYKFVFKAS